MAKIFHKKLNIWTSIALSLLIILIENPFAIMDIGLQLSYLGTMGIVLFSADIEKMLIEKFKIYEFVSKILSVTIAAQILLMPILMYNFNTFSITFFISNFLAGPLVGVVTLLGFINIFISFISLNLGKLMALISNLLLELLILIAKLGSILPFSNITVVTPYRGTVIVYYLIVFLIFLFFKFPKIQRIINVKKIKKTITLKIIMLIIVVILGNYIYKAIPKNMKIYFIDVGQRG